MLMRVVYWGTYDAGKPRNRILLRGLREQGVEIWECHASLWEGVEDKSQVTGWRARARLLLRWLASYPRLVARYLRLPRHDAVIIGYLGHLDVLVIWPFARLRGARIVWDAFLSLYDTVVEDRALIHRRHPLAFLIHSWEWLACRAADLVVLDTQAHADYFRRRYRLPAERFGVVMVGAEPETFPTRPDGPPRWERDHVLQVLFYGQLIPLHGIETILAAARLTKDEPIHWVIIGRGQMERRVEAMLSEQPLPRLEWIPWVPYGRLVDWIHRSDVCLGIFADTPKAARVIPNKVFQILTTGTPLITRDSPAIRELVRRETPGIFLVPPADPAALAEVLVTLARKRTAVASSGLGCEHPTIDVTPRSLGRTLEGLIAGQLGTRSDRDQIVGKPVARAGTRQSPAAAPLTRDI